LVSLIKDDFFYLIFSFPKKFLSFFNYFFFSNQSYFTTLAILFKNENNLNLYFYEEIFRKSIS